MNLHEIARVPRTIAFRLIYLRLIELYVLWNATILFYFFQMSNNERFHVVNLLFLFAILFPTLYWCSSMTRSYDIHIRFVMQKFIIINGNGNVCGIKGLVDINNNKITSKGPTNTLERWDWIFCTINIGLTSWYQIVKLNKPNNVVEQAQCFIALSHDPLVEVINFNNMWSLENGDTRICISKEH